MALRKSLPPQFGQASNGNKSGCMPRVESAGAAGGADVLSRQEVAAGVIGRIANDD